MRIVIIQMFIPCVAKTPDNFSLCVVLTTTTPQGLSNFVSIEGNKNDIFK